MLQGLLSSPSMELLSPMDNSPLWTILNQADANYQAAAAMEASLSQASRGLASTADYQIMAHYGLLNHPSILEGMDETQAVNMPPSSCCVNPGLSSNSATAGSSLGLGHKPHINIYSKQSEKATNMMLFKAQAAICATRRSWQEALSSPPRSTHPVSDTIENSNENCSHVIYPVNDSKASIASLVYPCTLTESAGEGEELPYNPSVDKAAYMIRAMLGGKEAVEGSAKWQEDLQILSKERQFSKSSNVDVESRHQHANPIVIDGPLYSAISDSCHSSLYKEEALHQLYNHENEKEAISMALTTIQQSPSANQCVSRKRPAAVAHLPSSSSSSYSKRAHLQNLQGAVSTTASVTTTTTTTTMSTTTKSSKSSSRNPQGPALNTNGKPRAAQGSANDPQSLAARNRRERINARLKVLQELVPNGSKVDLVTMLEKAINYVKYLQLQLRVLSNDDLWQASQDNLSEHGAAQARSEEGYNNVNENLNNNLAYSDTSEAHYTYMGDKLYKPYCKT